MHAPQLDPRLLRRQPLGLPPEAPLQLHMEKHPPRLVDLPLLLPLPRPRPSRLLASQHRPPHR
eukprot:9097468-Heterocapsa_arctica.AAC.1